MKKVNIHTTLWVRAIGFEWHIPHKVVWTLTFYVQKRRKIRATTDCCTSSYVSTQLIRQHRYRYIYLLICVYRFSWSTEGGNPLHHLWVQASPLISLLIDDDNVYFKKITTRVSQNLIIHKNAHQPTA
jgi:hypothetical protein